MKAQIVMTVVVDVDLPPREPPTGQLDRMVKLYTDYPHALLGSPGGSVTVDGKLLDP